ncbi:FdhD protein [Caloramator fervidus]|uniref:Sulfur carrier protein FdhD n=1 Tax=Caloramator fervidus TaxID=29344 RepID=A0A1H5XCQ2_9CLOT|nr:formate dehydrogenase accessory sulfurtransferase FdhD [Caloramator fervidus]SEG08986.1 FdhD protein [Caloramator fervidus]
MEGIRLYKIKRYFKDNVEELNDLVVVEYPINIFINNEFYITLMCLPTNIVELIYGFLFFDGIIDTKEDVKDIIINKQNAFINLNRSIGKINIKRVLTTGCGQGSIHIDYIYRKQLNILKHNVEMDYQSILKVMKKFNEESNMFKQTGGVHSAALCDNDIIFRVDDIGRHNAVDKVIGFGILNDINFQDKSLLITGRISSDMLIKAAKAKIPLVISHSAPTNMAIDLAKTLNIRLVGFVRGEKMNIYT